MSKHFSSESSHVAYQIKGNEAKSTMQVHILSLYTPSVPGVLSKGLNIFFLKEVNFHIKLTGVEHRAPCKHILCPYMHPQSRGLGQNIFL